MTPAARYAAAIEVLDAILAGVSAEKSLTTWARGHRFAGSKDRAAIRDHVFDVLRAKRSLGALGNGETGRALIIGLLRREEIALEMVFGAGGYAPGELTPPEMVTPTDTSSEPAMHDLPDWLWPLWCESLGEKARPAAIAQQSRAPTWLRVNLSRISLADAGDMLAQDQIATSLHPDVKSALQVIENERKVKNSTAFTQGYVELQDAASQDAMHHLPLAGAKRVLDYCAGGGGKALAIADMSDADIVAHDIDPRRMVDLPARATRAGVQIATCTTDALDQLAPSDVVLCDAPCSGSGTWRRTPEAKWALTPEKLNNYNRMQREVLASGARHVKAGGILAYATCSVLRSENDDIIDDFLTENAGWSASDPLRHTPSPDADGFFLVVLRNATQL